MHVLQSIFGDTIRIKERNSKEMGNVYVINRVVLVGRLTRDPELRYTPSGVANASFNLAVNRQYKNAQGETEADFIQIVVWRQLGELCANYLKKGNLCAVDGHLQTRSYENKEGRKVYVTEVVADNVQFLTPANTQGNTQSSNSGQSDTSRNTYHDPFANDSKHIDISDDDLPF